MRRPIPILLVCLALASAGGTPLFGAEGVPRFQDRADLDGGASWQFLTKLAGFVQEFGMAAYDAEIGARWWT